MGNGVRDFRNQVNIGRGSIPYINLEAADPSSQRPACLFVSSALNPGQSIVAVSNHRTVRDILLAFKSDARIHVTRYNPWKHDKRRHKILLIGLCSAASAASFMALIFKWTRT